MTLAWPALAIFVLAACLAAIYFGSVRGARRDTAQANHEERTRQKGAGGPHWSLAASGPAGRAASRPPEEPRGPIGGPVFASVDRTGRHGKARSLLSGRPLDEASTAPSVLLPHLSGDLSSESYRNVELGFRIAMKLAGHASACGALFTPFHASAADSLASTLYIGPTDAEKTRFCIAGVAAFTTVGGRITWLCPEFGTLEPWDAARTLLHEALHSAGMPESPSTPNALTSQQISTLVARACK